MSKRLSILPAVLSASIFSLSLSAATTSIEPSSLLPPLPAWKGASEALIQPASNPWQTPAEKNDLASTPDYEASVAFMNKLVASDPRLQKVNLGKSPQQRDIWMVIASQQGAKDAQSLRNNKKPTLLIQAGIHSGEIDGKDAGFMLLRDIIHGNKGALLDGVNILFVPILSVDGHERRSPLNRVNQRGPDNMGWRTNASNLNLNRDYAKLDTPELQHIIRAINIWQPDLYYDAHVTDGADYQYDITYGFNADFGDSPSISRWLEQRLRPSVDKALAANGHLGGPLIFSVDSMDFKKGISGWTASPRFSNGYGDLRQLPTVLIENHSLKPYKQRVLGTYVMFEETLKLLARDGKNLRKAIAEDRARRPAKQVLKWKTDVNNPELITLKGMEYKTDIDKVTGLPYVEWTGKPYDYEKLPVYWSRLPAVEVKTPRSFYIPAQYTQVIERLKIHGVDMEVLPKAMTIKATQLSAKDFKLAEKPFEGRQMVNSTFDSSQGSFVLPAGSMKVKTDQPLGRLVVGLLDPRGPDSFFSWGFFNSIFQRTEYIENYVLIPMARELFAEQPELKQAFEQKKQSDKEFAENTRAQMQWIYRHSPFYDRAYLKYPVLLEY
ncbi:M14 family metallopeptidase [Pleionea sp. CnH1-48]|uniref:M14 family metallopeptidase n=1 Tax=Pleionea sp. CnH1-48 TaxID=2954494 RepID=UPI0020972424|nr:M14 family metallopeptidase [Pleionea sp. CnH1-48]MCO7223357.1 M14 family metallopeptidase [Pleionea sp. CnH1-48]